MKSTNTSKKVSRKISEAREIDSPLATGLESNDIITSSVKDVQKFSNYKGDKAGLADSQEIMKKTTDNNQHYTFSPNGFTDDKNGSIAVNEKYNFIEKPVEPRIVEVTMIGARDDAKEFIVNENKKSKEDSLDRFNKTCNNFGPNQMDSGRYIGRKVEKLCGKIFVS